MRCNLALVSGFRDGVLDSSEQREFEAHLKTCGNCSRALAEYALVGQALRDLPVTIPPHQLRRDVMNRVAQPRPVRAFPLFPALAGFGAAAIVILAIAGLSARLLLSSTTPNVASNLAAASPTATVIAPAPATTGGNFAPSPTAPVAQATATQPSLAFAPPATPTTPPPAPTEPPPAVVPATPTEAPATPTTQPATPTFAPASPTVPATSPTAAATSTAAALSTTATATPRATSTVLVALRAPTNTPVPCSPRGRFQRIFDGDADLRDELGCANGTEIIETSSEVVFQRGVMIRRGNDPRVFVINDNGSWTTVMDEDVSERVATARVDGEPPAPFTRVYRSQQSVRNGLGASTSEVRAYPAVLQAYEHGLMLQNDRRIYVLYTDGSWETFQQR